MPLVTVLSDDKEFGKRIGAARGFRLELRPKFAKRLKTTDTTLREWEHGVFSSRYSSTEQRRQLAERVVKASGCPPEWFELREPPRDEALDQLRRMVAALSTLATTPDLGTSARQLLEAELAAARQWSSSIPPTGEPKTGAGNE